MRFKGTLILLIVCLGLGAYVYFYEIKGGERREKAKEAEKQVWKLEPEKITQIELFSTGERVTAVRNDEKRWTLTVPRTLEGDSDELGRLANSASNIQRENVVEENAADMSRFGLDPAQSGLKIKTKDGKEYALNFGHNNPTGNSAYAALPGKKEVFLVSSAVLSAFNKKTNDLRNQRVLSFDQSEVDFLSLKSSKGTVELTKDSNDQWWIAGPGKVAADSPGVRGILNAISMARVKEFFERSPDDKRSPGFDKPAVDVRLIYGKNRAMKHLVIGSEKSSLVKKGESGATPELYIAKDESRPDLFFVEKDLVDKLSQSERDIREKALATFQRWDVDFMSLTNTKGSFTFRKSGGEWFLGDTRKKARWEAVNAILDVMEKPVKDWIDNPGPLSTYGLDKPAIRVILKNGSNVIADCSLGKTAKDGGVFALLKGVASVKIADPEGLDALDKSEADLVEAPAAESTKK